jgi:hypothetical protein
MGGVNRPNPWASGCGPRHAPRLYGFLADFSGCAVRLKHRHLGAHTVQVKVRYSDFTTLTRQITVEDPVVKLGWTERGKHKLEVIITEEVIACAEIEETSAEVEDHEGKAITVEFLKNGPLVRI